MSNTMSCYLGFLLCKSFFDPPPQSKSSAKFFSATGTEPNSSSQRSSIQKDSVCCTVGAVSFSCLLSTIGIALALNTEKVVTSSNLLASEATVTFVYLNSSLNPILYCWKIRQVRQTVRDIVRQLSCCSCSDTVFAIN